jgi:SOS response regulatory protein OraA/RecX
MIYNLTHFEKFVESEVREVLAEYDINYTERARLRAIDILKNGKYSRSDLIKNLVDQWGFTKEESTNAVKDLKHENLID